MTVLHEAVASLPFNTEYAEIHMHPDDIELLRQVYDDEALIEQKWIIKEEPAYNLGDVVVMTPNSLIDRTVKQRMRQTIDKFMHKAELDKEIDESLIKTPDATPPNLSQADAQASLAERQAEMAEEAERLAEAAQEDHVEESQLEDSSEQQEANVEYNSDTIDDPVEVPVGDEQQEPLQLDEQDKEQE